jgi:hypothetical protein
MQKLLDSSRSMSLNMIIVIILRGIHDGLNSCNGHLFLAIIGVETVDFLFDVTPERKEN